jgi:hypothetical protein
MLEARDARVLGPGGRNVPRVVAVLVEVLGRGGDLVDGDTGPRLAKLAAALRADPAYAPLFDAAYAALSDKHKANFAAAMA